MAIKAFKTGNVPGPKIGVTIDGKIAGKKIKNAKNPLFIVGSMVVTEKAGEKNLSEYVIEIAKKLTAANHPIIATSNSALIFKDTDIPVKILSVVEVVDRLQDPEWSANGGMPHDLVVFLGIHYWLASQGLSTLKHFAPHLKTMTLCFMNHPNADWTFPNLSKEKWGKELEEVIKML
ncbi:MAG: CO dehydrogenase/acetyl-CoA synthase complex subunit epsilon [Candidatus Methanospirareceae archaeon]